MRPIFRIEQVIPSAARNLLVLLVFLIPYSASAQGPATGTPPFGSFGGGPDVVNLGNLNAHLDAPVFSRVGRGGFNFTYDLSYDSSVWYPAGASGNQTWQPIGNWGWRGQTEVATGYVSYDSTTSQWCLFAGQYYGSQTTYSNWVYHDSFGVSHGFVGSTVVQNGAPAHCNSTTTSMTVTTGDGSGWILSARGGSLNSITSISGTVIHPPVNTFSGAATATDRNGNQITADSSGHFYDTLSSTTPVLTVAGSGTPASPLIFTYTPPAGGSATVKVNYTQYTVNTYFHVGILEYPRTSVPLVSSIVLPDQSQYSFTYESTPAAASCTPLSGTTSCVTARIASITLPTGGVISYSYSFTGCTSGSNGIFSDGSASCLQRITPDGTWTYIRSLGSGAASTATITDPQNNQSVIQFQGIYETQRMVYQGSATGTPLWINTICYNGNGSNCPTTAVTLPIRQRRTNPQFGGTEIQAFHNYVYDGFGNLTEQDDYDWANGVPTTILRKILITYASLSNINAFSQTTTVQDGSGNTLAQTTNNYDESTPSTSSGTPQHVAVSGSRGNLTSTSRLVQGSTTLTTHFTYYDTGTPLTSTDVNGAVTTFSYPDAASTCGNAFTTKRSVTQPVSMNTQTAWNCVGGVPASVTDVNSRVTSVIWNDPYFWRAASVSFPDGGQTSVTYNSATSSTTTAKMNSSQNIVRTVLLDGLGRKSQTQLNSDPQGADYSVLTYDSLGRLSRAYNTTRCSPPTSNCGESTWGYSTQNYDPLGRPTSITLQDGSVSTLSYSNNTVTATDPAGKKRQSTIDSLGRITQVTEDPGGLGYITTYSYDALGNLTGVTQNGGRPRTYSFDGLSRLTSETNPETGTITYKYDSDSNCASPNSSSGDLISRTDARNIRTCLQYDGLHRLTQKNYSDGTTPTAFFAYEQTSAWGVTLTNTLGRLTEEWTGTSCCATGGAEIFSYDNMGRPVLDEQYTVKMGYVPVNYSYDLAGNLLTATNIGGYQTSYQYNGAGRPTAVTSSPSDSQHPATLLTTDATYGYYPHGALRKATVGNGLTLTNVVNNNLQPCLIDVNNNGTLLQTCNDSTPSGNVLDLWMNYNAGSSNNGNVAGWNATGDQSFVRTFGYDSLNRLSTMNQSSGNATGCSSAFGLSWGYDAWGNRTDQNVTGGSCNSFHATVNSLNQLVGPPYQYDAAGNMTNDGNHTYFYDAENRLIQVGGTLGTCSTTTVCYLYDALGHRAESNYGSTQLDFLHNLDGHVIGDWENNPGGYTGWATGYVYLNGGLLAQYQGSTTHFAHSDHLGSTRSLTDVNQAVVQNLDYLPFGELNSSDSGINSHKFTSDERDSETGLDHTWFRQYSSSLARWMHPDPAGLGAVDPSNPQSWNRYAYVNNNPLNSLDPFGLYVVCDGAIAYDYVDYSVDGQYQGTEVLYLGNYPGCILQTSQPWLTTPPPGNLPQLKSTPKFFGFLVMNPVPNNCSIWALLTSGFTVTKKVGFALEVGGFGFDASINTDTETQQRKIDASFSAFGAKMGAEKSLSPGILVPDNVDPNPEFAFQYGPFSKNLITGEVSESHSSTLYKVGGSLFLGRDISFDPQKMDDKIGVCQAK